MKGRRAKRRKIQISTRVCDGKYWCPKCKKFIERKKFGPVKNRSVGVAGYCRLHANEYYRNKYKGSAIRKKSNRRENLKRHPTGYYTKAAREARRKKGKNV